MKAVSVFDFSDYKSYVKAWIATHPARGRGQKKLMAEVMRCHSTYVSQVLHGPAHLNLEQASSLSEMIGHNMQEGRFFLLLLQRERAGNRSLKQHFESQIQEILESRTALRNRLEIKRTLEEKDQATYYSSWLYAAVHMLITIPEFQTREALSKRLQIPTSRVLDIITFLISVGLVNDNNGRFTAGASNIHLGDHAPLISKHHTNWRIRSVNSLDAPQLHDLHYSSLGTLNEKDLPKIRSIMIKTIEEIRTIVKSSSPEDTLFCYNLDLFRV